MGSRRERIESEQAQIRRIRERYGLRTYEPEIVTCLRCGDEFEAYDPWSQRICKQCKINNTEVLLLNGEIGEG